MAAADLDRAIELVAAGRVDLSSLITHRFSLKDAPAAFAALASRQGINVVIQPNGAV
jgi:threonine dehydrogenase-like Zn-dependent dehydrogenase